MTTAQAESAFFDLSLDLLCIIGRDGRIQRANPAFLQIFGKPEAAVMGTPLQHFITIEDAPLRGLATLSMPLSFECRLICFDESERNYLWTLYPAQGAQIHVVGKDITPYKEMERRESERNVFAEALLDTVLAMNTTLALDQVLGRMLANIGRVVAYNFVTIMLVDGSIAEIVGRQNLEPHRLRVDLENRDALVIADHPHLQAMAQSRDCIIVPQVQNPPQWMTDLPTGPAGSFLGAPIIVDDDVIGFLNVFILQLDFFTRLHAQQLMTFANQAGIALNNAQLYQQAQSAAILRERQRVAQELHDSVNQELFAARTYADLLPRAIKHKPQAVQRYANEISRLIRGAVAQMRMILIELHPDTLTKTRLDVLLKQLCTTFEDRVGVGISFQSTGQVLLDEAAQVAFYRIAQEALHNVEKHAQATNVLVSLAYTEDTIQMMITDDGVGFDLTNIGEIQFGVRGMHERAQAIGAQLSLTTDINQGTQIELRKVLNHE